MAERIEAQFERPQRPASLNPIIVTCGQVIKNFFGEEAFVLTPKDVHWTSDEELEHLYRQRPVSNRFMYTVLTSLGMDLAGKQLKDETDYLRDEQLFPPQIYIRASGHPGLDASDLRGRTLDEFNLAFRILYYNVLNSRIPKIYSDEILDQTIEEKLERDRKSMPLKHPQINKEALNIAADNIKLLVSTDPTRRTILDGAEIKVVCAIRDADGEKEEDIAITGVDFEQELSEYLAHRAVLEFFKSWIENYSPNEKEIVLKRFREMNADLSPDQRFFLARTEAFLKIIGLSGYRNIFNAHLNSEIPLKFIKAKGKNKKLVYPS